MVAILVLDAFDHLRWQLIDDLISVINFDIKIENFASFSHHLHLRFRVHRFQRLLDDSTAVHLQCQREHLAAERLQQLGLLFVRAILEEFLEGCKEFSGGFQRVEEQSLKRRNFSSPKKSMIKKAKILFSIPFNKPNYVSIISYKKMLCVKTFNNKFFLIKI